MPIQSPELHEHADGGGTTCVNRTLRMRGRADGLHYERECISSWFDRQSNSAPILTAKHEMEKDAAGCRALNRIYIVGGLYGIIRSEVGEISQGKTPGKTEKVQMTGTTFSF